MNHFEFTNKFIIFTNNLRVQEKEWRLSKYLTTGNLYLKTVLRNTTADPIKTYRNRLSHRVNREQPA